MLASRLTIWSTRGLDSRAALATALAAAVFLSRVPLTTMVGGMRLGGAHPDVVFSEPALAFVRTEGLSGPVFNSHNLGGWLAWTMYPDVRVFQDSRLQAYPPEHFRAILDASRSQPAWDALVSGVDWAVLSMPRPNALSGAGRFPDSGWATVYADDAVEILVSATKRAKVCGDRWPVIAVPRARVSTRFRNTANVSLACGIRHRKRAGRWRAAP